jgi:hypothetical protein
LKRVISDAGIAVGAGALTIVVFYLLADVATWLYVVVGLVMTVLAFGLAAALRRGDQTEGRGPRVDVARRIRARKGALRAQNIDVLAHGGDVRIVDQVRVAGDVTIDGVRVTGDGRSADDRG